MATKKSLAMSTKKACQEYGLKPIIWSDMIFCILSEDMSLQGYYTHNIDVDLISNVFNSKSKLNSVPIISVKVIYCLPALAISKAKRPKPAPGTSTRICPLE